MKSFVAGTALSIEVLFALGGDTVVPDVASVSYTVRDKSGAGISGLIDLPVTTTTDTTSIAIAVPQSANTKTLLWEMRFITVTFMVAGQTSFIEVMYRLTDRIPLSINIESVRALVGLASNELPDDDIDIPMAYYLTADDIGKSLLDAALIAGTGVAYAANRAVASKALLELLPSLQLRALSSESSQTAAASRLPNIDFEKLEAWLKDLYSKAQLIVKGVEQGALPILAVAKPVDTITGA